MTGGRQHRDQDIVISLFKLLRNCYSSTEARPEVWLFVIAAFFFFKS